MAAQVLTPVEEALKAYLSRLSEALKPLPAEEVPVPEGALGRVLAEDVVAPVDLPPFNRAVMDGYAVRAEDTFGAKPDKPARLKLVGRVAAGQASPGLKIGPGECAEVATGAALPEGANAVVRAEYARADSDSGVVEVYMPVSPGESVDEAGRDVKAGQAALERGRLLRAPDIALLLALGLRSVKVFRRPKVGVLAIGSELVNVSEEPGPGQIRDVDRPMIMLMAMELGAEPVDLGIAPDDAGAIREVLLRGLEACDVVLTTGGASVGRADLAVEAIRGLEGAEVIVHRVAMRPGRPVALALARGKPIIALPGPPAACFLAFQVFARPVLLKLMGVREGLEPIWPTVRARLARRVPSKVGFTDLVRVRLLRGPSGGLIAEPLAARGAGIISSLARANGILAIPGELDVLEEGEEVEVLLLSCPELAEVHA